ncbi:MAG: mechanosensitive ion channel family protein [Holosporales bacterium]|jgi:small conductance mechanosensitive channel|nr:mechanosensitive ion channel family protein [Holosporales bacterium]
MLEIIPHEQTGSFIDFVNFSNFDRVSLVIAFFICIGCLIICHSIKKIKQKFLFKTENRKKNKKISNTSYHFLMMFIPAVESFLRFSVLLFGGTLLLATFGVTISPIVYFVSLLSVCISFGAKDIFTDIIRGILTLIEGKIALGNFVKINGSCGVVKSLNIRQIEMQHEDGSIEIFPFSKISTIRNYSLDYSSAEPLFRLVPHADIKKFEEFSNETFQEMMKNDIYKECIHEKTIDSLSVKIKNIKNKGIEVKVSIIITPGKHSFFESEFNKIMVKKLQKAGMLF